jgi:hypothetical protein
LALLVVHIVTAVSDSFAPIGYVAAFVPGSSPYRPLWLGLGAVAFDLLLALAATSALRRFIGQRAWRGVHWLAYASWPIALLHGLGTGTDTRVGLNLALDAVSVLAVLAAVGWRVTVGWPRAKAVRLAASGAAAAFPIAVVAFVATGPLSRDWALRAGTPRSLLASLARPASSAPRSRSVAPPTGSPTTSPQSPARREGGLPALPFSAELSGSYTSNGPDASGLVSVDITAQLSGAAGTLEIVLRGPPIQGGVAMTSSRVTLDQASGQVVALDGDRVVAVVDPAGGAQVRLDIRLQLDPTGGTVSGVLRAESASGSDGLGSGEGGQ